MKICVATSSFPSHPEDRMHAPFLLDAIGCLRRAGHQVSVLTQARSDNPRAPPDGVKVEWFPWRRRDGRLAELNFGSPTGALSALSLVYNGSRAVAAQRRDFGADVFLCAWVIPSGLYVYLDHIFGRGDTPYVLWALGSDVNKYKDNPLVRHVIKRVAGRAAHLYADGYELCDSLSRISGKECEFLPTFRPIRVKQAGAPDRRRGPKFLYVGRHSLVKGTDLLVEALFALERTGGAEYAFDIVGDGELTRALRNRIERAGLASKVRFRGRVDDEELYELYAASDCVVIPSRSESIPVVLSEALQAGKPLIVTDVGDMGRVVHEHELGQVVPKEDVGALASAIRAFIENPRLPSEIGRTRLLSDLMFESAAPKLLRRLEQIVGSA